MNHEGKALSRIIWQYRNSDKLKAWVSIIPQIGQEEIEAAAERIIRMLDIDNAVGELLDVVGEIVGQPRPYVDADVFAGDWFGWRGNAERQGWGAPWQPRNAAGAASILMPDTYYRILIKAKIAKNNSYADIDGIREALEFITGSNVGDLDDRQDMTFSVVFSTGLTIQARTILQNFDVVPRPQAVRFLSFSEPDQDEYFGYIGDPNARPYGVAPYAEVL